MYIALYEAVCKMQEKINELVDRVNSFDPTGSTDYVKTVNGMKGAVKLTGDNIPYNQLKTVNKQITDNKNEIQTVKQNIADLDLSHVLAGSSAQIQLMQQNTFNSITDSQWTAFYDSGFRVVGIVDSGYTEIQTLYLQNTNPPHKPIPIKKEAGGSGVSSVNGKSGAVVLTGDDIAVSDTIITKIGTKLNTLDQEIIAIGGKVDESYSPTNTPPYPVTSVNGQTGAVVIQTGGGGAITTKNLTLTYDDSYGGFTFPSDSGVSKDNILNVIVTAFSGSGFPANFNYPIIIHDGIPHVHIYGVYSDKTTQEWGASGNTVTAIVQVK